MELARALHLIDRISSPGFIHHGCDERDELEQGVANLVNDIERAEKRIQAVRDLHRPVGLTAHTGPRIKPGGEPVPDDTQVCDYCTDPDTLGWCEYPCPTVEALNGDA